MGEIAAFDEALHYLHVEELRDICEKYSLPNQGKKGELISRILHFMKTGEVILSPKIPPVSCAKKGTSYELQSDGLILKGAYKNDLKTRLFFKTLIGEHFHFTAFGIDWINEHWFAGNPPTYQQFADMWKAEYARRKNKPATPKKEWAYINFTQRFLKQNPQASREFIIAEWDKERAKQKEVVSKFFCSIVAID